MHTPGGSLMTTVQPSRAHPHPRPARRQGTDARTQDAQAPREQAVDQLCGRREHERRGVCARGDAQRGGHPGGATGGAQGGAVYEREQFACACLSLCDVRDADWLTRTSIRSLSSRIRAGTMTS